MRESLRVLGLAVLAGGALTLLALSVAQSFDTASPALADWPQSADIRRVMWGVAGVLYLLAGLLLLLLRRWSAVLLIVASVIAAASMAYDMAAFAGADIGPLGVGRIRADIISLVFALGLSALTVPLVRRRVLK